MEKVPITLASHVSAIGQAAAGQLDIRRLSLPYLRELNQQTRETIHLTVRHGLSAVYVEKLDSPEPLRIYSRIGASVPLALYRGGKVMLAYLPADEQERVLPATRIETADAELGGQSCRNSKRNCSASARTGMRLIWRSTSCISAVWRLRSGTTPAACNRVSASPLRHSVCP